MVGMAFWLHIIVLQSRELWLRIYQSGLLCSKSTAPTLGSARGDSGKDYERIALIS